MPREKRIQIQGAIHHVITRGLERRDIFLDDTDRREFLTRLERALEKTGCQCFGWALMSNHFHLLIRTGIKSLSDLMRKILTGYAIYFNRKYKRHGYVYQNRYKSVLCQEDEYLLELVRYIHTNPIRAGIVNGLNELDQYPWTGHAVLMGRVKRFWQSTDEVLILFGMRRAEARGKYREFIRDGIHISKRDDLIGGDLRRSAGGWEEVKRLRKKNESWRGDERILGNRMFVEEVLKAAEEKIVSNYLGISRQGIFQNIEKGETTIREKGINLIS